MNLDYDKDSKERVPFAHYLEEYQKLDPTETAARTGIPYDSEKAAFGIRFLQQEYLVSWPDFVIGKRDRKNGQYSALIETIPAKILVIRFLCKGAASVSTGKFLTYREVPWGEFYFKPFEGRCLKRLAYGYGSKPEFFAAQMEKIGSEKLDSGDVSYEFEFLNNHFVRFILWTGDDEFPPSAQILYSDNFLLSFSAEDLAVVGDVSIGTLKKIK